MRILLSRIQHRSMERPNTILRIRTILRRPMTSILLSIRKTFTSIIITRNQRHCWLHRRIISQTWLILIYPFSRAWNTHHCMCNNSIIHTSAHTEPWRIRCWSRCPSYLFTTTTTCRCTRVSPWTLNRNSRPWKCPCWATLVPRTTCLSCNRTWIFTENRSLRAFTTAWTAHWGYNSWTRCHPIGRVKVRQALARWTPIVRGTSCRDEH